MRRILAAGLLAFAAAAAAQTWPSKPVRIVVAYPPGGGIDVLGRQLAEKLTAGWAQPVVVENRPGANTIVAAPDPCWLLLRSLKTLRIRVERQTATARELARRLGGHPAVELVRYPGFGGLISFDVAGGDAAHRVETATRLITNATSLGGTHSTMESRHRWEGDRIPAGLLRLSVGLEGADELWADLKQALDQV